MQQIVRTRCRCRGVDEAIICQRQHARSCRGVNAARTYSPTVGTQNCFVKRNVHVCGVPNTIPYRVLGY
eukprot:scaffold168703_cov53-Prasinocladus_malaysianus.AAC.1